MVVLTARGGWGGLGVGMGGLVQGKLDVLVNNVGTNIRKPTIDYSMVTSARLPLTHQHSRAILRRHFLTSRIYRPRRSGVEPASFPAHAVRAEAGVPMHLKLIALQAPDSGAGQVAVGPCTSSSTPKGGRLSARSACRTLGCVLSGAQLGVRRSKVLGTRQHKAKIVTLHHSRV